MSRNKVIAIFISIGILGGGTYLYDPHPENPNSSALAKGSEQYSAEIIRDLWGVPHIFGQRDADVSFGLAYAHAEDDFETIQETLAATRGVLASYRGTDAIPADYIVGLLNVWPTIDERYRTDVPDDVKTIAEAYAAGLNLFASEHPGEIWPGLAPFKAEDVVAGFIFKTPFFYGIDKVLMDLLDEDRKQEIALDPSGESQAWTVRKDSKAELGSNAIAVNRSRSGDETTRLLINSHQPMTGPVAWYEAHLVSQEGMDITGGLFPGTPFILHGFNRHLGWANTVNHIDLTDVYALERHADDDSLYKLDGEWKAFEEQQIAIKIHLWGPFFFTTKQTILRSEHGPVIENGDNAYALRYAGMDEIRQLEQYYRFNRASDFASFKDAMRLNALPSINYVYADKNDQIAFIHNAQYPRRVDGWNWKLDLPGNRSDLIWHEYLSFAEMPVLENPQSGLIYNANNQPFHATDGDDNLIPEDFPEFMGLATDETNRSIRLGELSPNFERIGKEQLLELKFDDRYSEDSEQYGIIKQILGLNPEDDEFSPYQDHLAQWDRYTNIENPHAALAILALRHIYREDRARGSKQHSEG